MKRYPRFPLIHLLALAMLAGCGPDGPEVASVEGTVTLDGKPLPGATVIFTPVKGGRPAVGGTNEEGKYELTYTEDAMGATPGEYQVRISTYSQGDPGMNEKPVPEKIPARYNRQSELKKTVKPGQENVINFKLSSEGQIMEPSRLH